MSKFNIQTHRGRSTGAKQTISQRNKLPVYSQPVRVPGGEEVS